MQPRSTTITVVLATLVAGGIIVALALEYHRRIQVERESMRARATAGQVLAEQTAADAIPSNWHWHIPAIDMEADDEFVGIPLRNDNAHAITFPGDDIPLSPCLRMAAPSFSATGLAASRAINSWRCRAGLFAVRCRG